MLAVWKGCGESVRDTLIIIGYAKNRSEMSALSLQLFKVE